ncbi:FixH family protein [Bacillus cihuensis]|uniref:FixH family protein n=1 Tax=Bacillus cihuensis TaxID=1208599 RepID=UPI000418361E|nr:FixH family protein [Bacillus cihuensis]
MRKKVGSMLVIVLMIVLVACSNLQEKDIEPKMLNVDLTINPKQAEVNDVVTFKAKVTYGDEEVMDADEVKFEIWRSQSENHETIEVKHLKDGVYQLEKTFSEEGTYYVYAHVTAKDLHNMPKEEFVIGTASEPEEKSTSKSMNDDIKHNHHDK